MWEAAGRVALVALCEEGGAALGDGFGVALGEGLGGVTGLRADVLRLRSKRMGRRMPLGSSRLRTSCLWGRA